MGVLLGAAYVGDGWARDRELGRLLDDVRAGQATVAYADARVAATMRYTQPLLGSASVPASVRAGLGDLVADEARGQLGPVTAARTQALRVRVLPWHDALQRARASYAGYLETRLTYLRAGADDVRVLLRPHPASKRSLEAAERALVDAGATVASARAALATPAA